MTRDPIRRFGEVLFNRMDGDIQGTREKADEAAVQSVLFTQRQGEIFNSTLGGRRDIARAVRLKFLTASRHAAQGRLMSTRVGCARGIG